MFFFFTVQSNIFIILMAFLFLGHEIISLFTKKYFVNQIILYLKYVATVAITVTFLVFFTMLAPLMGMDYLLSFNNFSLHAIVPILAIIDFIIYDVDIELTYNIKFPKLYSEYAIDRVFTSGTIAEDRLLVEYYLMTNIIINDMRACIFDRFYLVDFEPTIFDDKQRLEKLLGVANNDCFKNQVILKVKYDEFAKYGNNIKDMIKDGYSFAIKVDKEIDKSEYILFDIFKYIIVEKDIDKLKGKEIIINNR